ncbi:fungal-specific transcription factor domain-containing protein [Pestalotiopsis sp. NC0098]|nr:fungal-specific transcription factor domain-containing protein [Pestalotiopsis sp. NC0098]
MQRTATKSYTRRDKKSRSGCRQCKQKRIRCDETRPACINCVRSGLACPGYRVSLCWSTKHEQPTSSSSSAALGPADFELLASTASQAIHGGGRRAGNTGSGRTLGATPVPDYALPAHAAQYGGTVQSPAVLNGHSQATPPPDASLSPIGFYPLPLLSDSPISIHALTPCTTEYPVDISLPAEAAVTDTGWLIDDRHSPLLSPPHVMSSPVVSHSEIISDTRTCADRVGALGSPKASLVHLPTFLVQHWFGSVCRYWSAFDSESNPLRLVAGSLWGSSQVVFYSLQSMSAATLAETMPDCKEITNSAPSLAVQAISEELTELYTSEDTDLRFPCGLVLGLFCMGSSTCWDDPKKTGSHFYRQASKLMRYFQLRSDLLSDEDRQLLDFFGGCMKYEEMVRNVAGEPDAPPKRVSGGENHRREISIRPHAWTGVSPDILGLFGEAILLCRQECARRRGQTNMTRESLREALAAIDEAQALEEALLAVEPACLQPDDPECAGATRWAHLRDSTEGYRVASLLQLYQTFPDLVARRIPEQVGSDGLVPNSSWLVPLALYLMAILERTPPSSDLRCIQPLLYLSAGSCLSYDDLSATSSHTGSRGDGSAMLAPDSTPQYLASVFPTTCFVQDETSKPPHLDVRSARKLITERLEQLEQVLPPKPIRVAQQLMKATWEVFDGEICAQRKTHWLDVMTSTSLTTLFG